MSSPGGKRKPSPIYIRNLDGALCQGWNAKFDLILIITRYLNLQTEVRRQTIIAGIGKVVAPKPNSTIYLVVTILLTYSNSCSPTSNLGWILGCLKIHSSFCIFELSSIMYCDSFYLIALKRNPYWHVYLIKI